MQVSNSDLDDWKKLRWSLIFLKNTIDEKRIIGAMSLSDLYTWIDFSYAVHENMQGHTGGAMSMSFGIIHGKRSKQKLNLKSSMEPNLFGFSEYLPYNLWMLLFMEAQGYGIVNNTIYQVNQSTIRMLKNRKNMCTENSRHINIRYFFIMDQIKNKNIVIEYCPTKNMIADYFTKPLKGKLFYNFRDQILGLVPIEGIHSDHRSVLESKLTLGKNESANNVCG